MGFDAPSGEITGGRLARAAATGILARDSGEGCVPWCACRKIDTCGIRTHAGRPPIGLAGRRLSHSAKVSMLSVPGRSLSIDFIIAMAGR